MEGCQALRNSLQVGAWVKLRQQCSIVQAATALALALSLPQHQCGCNGRAHAAMHGWQGSCSTTPALCHDSSCLHVLQGQGLRPGVA